MQIPHPSIGEILGKAGYDWVAVDLEHGSIATSDLPNLFRAIELGGASPFARVAQGKMKDVKAALDAGARGLIIPMVQSAAQLEEVIAECLFPPAGKRGVGFSRANLFGKNFDQYVAQINEQLVIVAQIEHIDAVKDLDNILANPRLDAIMVGPYDLSASMGITGQFQHPEFVKAMNAVRTACEKRKFPAGVHVVTPNPTELKNKIIEGYKFIAYSIDGTFLHLSATCPALA